MPDVHNLRSLLTSLVLNTEGEEVSVEALMNAVGRRSYGPILLMLGFVALTPIAIIPGANWLMALLVLIIALQILIGRAFPWVPRRALDFTFKRDLLVRGVAMTEPYARTVDRFLKPRLTVLTATPFVQLVALICIGAALVTFPLGFVPFGPTLPSLTILLFGLGLTARDGLVIALAGASLAGAGYILVRVWANIAPMLGL